MTKYETRKTNILTDLVKKYIFFKTTTIMFFIYFFNINTLSSMLLEENDLNPSNYTKVHIWNNMLKGGVRAGHAALEIWENNSQVLEISLHPDIRTVDALYDSVSPAWHTIKEDGDADTIVRLYSLNRTRMKNIFQVKKNQIKTKYTLTGNGDDSPFSDDTDARNCACIVRDLLNAGGMNELFKSQANKIVRFPRALPAAGEILAGTALGVGGLIAGGGVGFLKGIITLRNPLETAWRDARNAARICSYIPLDWASRNFSAINYGHTSGESLVVYPGDILNLAIDARSIEKKRFPRSKLWEDGKIYKSSSPCSIQ